MAKQIRVMIGVPVYQSCHVETMSSIYDLAVPYGVETRLVFAKGYTVDQARNHLAAAALQGGFDYVFYVDGDVILPADALQKLLALDASIATGWYRKKMDAHVVELFRTDANGTMVNITSLPESGLIEIQACGFGCTLVKCDVLRSVSDRLWFEYIQRKDQYANYVCSEDIDFCIKATQKGHQIVADASLRCGHIGQTIY